MSSLDKCWTPVCVGVCAFEIEGDHTCFLIIGDYNRKLNFHLSNWQFAAWKTACTCLRVLVCMCVWVCMCVYSIMAVRERESNPAKIFSCCVCALIIFWLHHFCSFSCWVWEFLFPPSEKFHFPSDIVLFFFLRSVMPDNSKAILDSAFVVFAYSE